ncbi:hypothetical protein ABZV58_13450 [Nocardia sp. NPDC004654]|uniref:hypothetical protein n=1 Tax=Nocardia sp. NPDC004654 TaxID=3154776 RepID=UPI0033AB45FB
MVTTVRPPSKWTRDTGIRFEIELREPLPDICSEHGLPAVDRRSETIAFHEGTRGREQLTPGSMFRALAYKILSFGFNALEIDTRFRGEWPVCHRCLQSSRRYKRLGRSIVFFGLFCIAGLVIAKILQVHQVVIAFLAVGLFPIWFPAGLLVASMLHRRANTFLRCRPIIAEDTVVVEAHPRFAAAMAGSTNGGIA